MFLLTGGKTSALIGMFFFEESDNICGDGYAGPETFLKSQEMLHCVECSLVLNLLDSIIFSRDLWLNTNPE